MGPYLGVVCLLGWEILTGKLVELDGVGGEAGGIGAESESRDVVVAVAEELGIAGQDKRVVDGDCGLGGGGRHDVVGLLVPHHRAVRRPPATARGPLGASKF
ncbi:hypothetical protein C1H46_033355 [Malus baccata]|uniref:Uncharacterized protein n=1 Tax=Malus baccata TaxID=106549 RepID=A0A540L3M7_MALBA|nr:hypothetical protein C1H46_033355 [Malus baccata]